MKKETRKFITYYMPGSFMAEDHTEQVTSFDIPAQIPRDVYSFQFHETDFAIDDDGVEFRGKTRTEPTRHYIGTLVPVGDIVPTADNHILRGNIERNSPTKTGIRTHLGNWQMEDENTKVHSPKEFTFTTPLIYKNIQSEAA